MISGYIACYLHKWADLVLLSSLKQPKKTFSFSSRVIVLDLAKTEFLIFSPHPAEKQSDRVWVGTWCTARVTPPQSQVPSYIYFVSMFLKIVFKKRVASAGKYFSVFLKLHMTEQPFVNFGVERKKIKMRLLQSEMF